jgi:hypothetical protein
MLLSTVKTEHQSLPDNYDRELMVKGMTDTLATRIAHYRRALIALFSH